MRVRTVNHGHWIGRRELGRSLADKYVREGLLLLEFDNYLGVRNSRIKLTGVRRVKNGE